MDTHGRSMLPELLERAAAIDGVRWLRVLYCYPDEADGRLLAVMAEHENICRYLDLPLQHAHPELLKRMNRRGDIGEIKAFLRKARDMGFTLRTTMIVGFPGETEEHFRALMDFVREMEFDRLGAFTFSPEEDTPAAEMPNQVPEDVKARAAGRADDGAAGYLAFAKQAAYRKDVYGADRGDRRGRRGGRQNRPRSPGRRRHMPPYGRAGLGAGRVRERANYRRGRL